MTKAHENPKVRAAVQNLMATITQEQQAGRIQLTRWSLFICNGASVDGVSVSQTGAGCDCSDCHDAIAQAADQIAQHADDPVGPGSHGAH